MGTLGDGFVRCNFLTVIILLTIGVLFYVLILQKEVQDEFDNRIHVPDYLIRPVWFRAPPDKVISFVLDFKSFLHHTDKRFLSFSIDSSQIYHGLRNPSLTNQKLKRIVSHLNGGYIRIGGRAADQLVFTPAFRAWPDKNLPLDGGSCSYEHKECPERSIKPKKFSMHAYDWNDLNDFASATGFKMLFDLNVLLRQNNTWNSSNAELLLDFSFAYHYNIDWQLGNEPNSLKHIFGIEIPPDVLAKDFNTLKKLLKRYKLYNSSLVIGPDITSPLHDPETDEKSVSYLLEFLKAGPNIDVISWHHYNTPSDASLEDFLDIETYNKFLDNCKIIFETVKKSKISPKPVWLTETGSSFGGGAHNLSDRFVSSLLWADKLGLAAKSGISVVVRQSLYRGNYALIDPSTLIPNPDYWVSLLYKRLVKETVLNLTSLEESEPSTLRTYAHCSTNKTVVVFGVNIANISQGVFLPMNTTGKFYCLHSSDLLSKSVELNGDSLTIHSDGSLPALNWITGIGGGVKATLLYISHPTGESSSSITCVDVIERGSGSAFSIEELKSLRKLNVDGIKDCIILLGKDELSQEQSKTIWTSIVKVFGAAIDIPEENLQHLGWIANGIEPDSFYNLSLTDIDTISSFGRRTSLSEEQMSALHSAIFEQWSSKEVDDLSSFDLVALRQILCAFNGTEILKIHPDAYKDAALELATLSNCSKEVFEALATLASNPLAFGDPKYWTSIQVATIGCIISGLPSIKVIPTEAMEGFTKDTITCLPVERIKELSNDHFMNLSPSAAGSLSKRQLSALIPSQRYAIEVAVKGLPYGERSTGGKPILSVLAETLIVFVNWRIFVNF